MTDPETVAEDPDTDAGVESETATAADASTTEAEAASGTNADTESGASRTVAEAEKPNTAAAGQRDDGQADTDAGEAGASSDRAEADSVATVRSSTVRATNHWVGVASVAFLTAGLGIALESRPLVLAAVVGVTYLAYANLSSPPTPTLAVRREVTDARPEPGDRVDVTVTVENVGEAALVDLRLVEQVPGPLSVVEGPARTATALRPGARVTFTYTVVARRGEYDLDGLTAIVRNASGSLERELRLGTTATTVTCVPPIDATEEVPLRALTAPYTGRVPTDTTGDGVEFASLREYQHGDSLSRIDWNRYARDGSLATMEFREERMATVVVLLDLREEAYVQPGEDGLHAVDRGIDATHRVFNSLLDTGDRVGIAALAPVDIWLAPGAGPTHQAEARHLLATHPALSPSPPREQVYIRPAIRTLEQRLSDDAQVVFCSPMVDDGAAYVARALQARDHPVTVISPNPTSRETVGQTLAAVDRSNRLSRLRASGIRVIDWEAEESLVEAIERARRRWSA